MLCLMASVIFMSIERRGGNTSQQLHRELQTWRSVDSGFLLACQCQCSHLEVLVRSTVRFRVCASMSSWKSAYEVNDMVYACRKKISPIIVKSL